MERYPQSSPGYPPSAFDDRPVVEAAGRFRRLFAYVLDGIFLAIPAFVVMFAISLSITLGLEQDDDGAFIMTPEAEQQIEDATILVMAGAAVLSALYFIILHALTGQTLGKKILGIRVIDLRSGNPPGLPAAILRYLILGGLGLVMTVLLALGIDLGIWYSLATVIFLVVAGWVLFHPLRRGLHDLAAETAVVRNQPQAPGNNYQY